ncbi:response regulator transcription factor [Gordonia sp. (in: high G+C Gram-positive bacteria)]|uniref:response regulator transcription factor n=1 Tax=Gordonia sp. (in: high G+C Gram-positive bacteria) TaxID=84139 RepID=UPI003526E245
MLVDDHGPVPDDPVDAADPARLRCVAPQRPAGDTGFRRPNLSQREIEVLLTWLRAESKEDAARELFISPATVSTHIIRIRAKYAAVGRPAKRKAALFARAVQDGYTTLDEW